MRNCSSQSEKSGQPMREQKYSHWRKQLTDIQGERKRVDLGLKWKVSTLNIRIKKSGLKFIHSKVPSSNCFKGQAIYIPVMFGYDLNPSCAG